jgi:heat shock protein 4
MQALAEAGIPLEDVASVEVTGGSSRVPAIIAILKDFFKKDPSRTLNATEVISRGCALNCAMLSPIFRSGTLPESCCTSPLQRHT